ncbi:hypothetical protein AB5J62_22730 [Amycolatopsis sp. cg5]|uniref:hypothetical protein n=1 Tax=Amycolatopsis sp. cg5 TaxID=3238802 RepID=UPI0035249CCC
MRIFRKNFITTALALILAMGGLGITAGPAQAAPAAACEIANVQLTVTNWGSDGGFHAYCYSNRYVAATTAFYDSTGRQLAGQAGRTLVFADGQWHWLTAPTNWGGVWLPVVRGCIWITLDNPGGPLLTSYCVNK